MPTYNYPSNLGDILGAHHNGNLHTEVFELKPDLGVLTRGTVLSVDSGTGKLIKTTATNETAAYGVLLDPSVDTAVKFGDATVTASVARSGTFRGAALIVGVGTNAAVTKSTLRDIGIFIEGSIPVPAAMAFAEEATEPEERQRKHEVKR